MSTTTQAIPISNHPKRQLAPSANTTNATKSARTKKKVRNVKESEHVFFFSNPERKDTLTAPPVERGHVTFLLQGRYPPSFIHGRVAPLAPYAGVRGFFVPLRETPEGFHLRAFSRSRRECFEVVFWSVREFGIRWIFDFGFFSWGGCVGVNHMATVSLKYWYT